MSLFCKINHPEDMDNMTDLEKKHYPVISVPDVIKADEPFEVTVEVGKLLTHPNEHGHFVQFIDLYVEYLQLARIDLTAVTTLPTMKVMVKLGHAGKTSKLRAFARCNLHGVWESVKEVTVS